MEVFETVAFVMRYWFLVLIAVTFLVTALVSFSEYREKKRTMLVAGNFYGYIECVSSDDPEDVGFRVPIAEVTTVGRSHNCDLSLNARGLRGRHARIFYREDGAFAVGFRGCAVDLNGERIAMATQVFTGDFLKLGGAVIEVHLKEEL